MGIITRRVAVTAAALGLMAVFGGTPAAHAGPNLLVNGSFQTGDFTGWTLAGNTGGTLVQTAGGLGAGATAPGEPDPFYAAFGPHGSIGLLYQSIPTQAGHTYTFSFWMAFKGSDPNNLVNALWNSVNAGPPFPMINPPSTGTGSGAYRFFSLTEAGTGAPTLVGFEAQNNPDYFSIDGVAVNDLSAIPEPGALALLAFGGVLVAGAAWRRSRRFGPA
jgi:hypothetical protein